MGEAAAHEFHRSQAAPALMAAMENLARKTGSSLAELEGITMGEAYSRACAAYEELPDFWVVWADWNNLPEEPRPMGDL